jgi:hypothetical protein
MPSEVESAELDSWDRSNERSAADSFRLNPRPLAMAIRAHAGNVEATLLQTSVSEIFTTSLSSVECVIPKCLDGVHRKFTSRPFCWL